MANIDLTEQEFGMLGEILASYLSDLRMEVAATDSREVRGTLKEREVMLKGLMERLAAVRTET